MRVVDQLSRRLEDESAGHARAPMHGRIVAVHVAPGAQVAAGDRLFSIEAMKMEHTVKAGAAGTVEKVLAAAGEDRARRDLAKSVASRVASERPTTPPDGIAAVAWLESSFAVGGALLPFGLPDAWLGQSVEVQAGRGDDEAGKGS